MVSGSGLARLSARERSGTAARRLHAPVPGRQSSWGPFTIDASIAEGFYDMAKLVVCPHEDADGEVCGAEVRSDDSEEVISTVQAHAEAKHDLELSRKDVEQMMQEA